MDERVQLALHAQMYKEPARNVAPKSKAMKVRSKVGGATKGKFTPIAFLEQHKSMTVGPPYERAGVVRDVIEE